MTLEKHDLAHDFPEHRDTITKLKEQDAHFSKQYNKYHEVTHEVHNIEANQINVDENHFEQLKIERAALKDELYQAIKSAEA